MQFATSTFMAPVAETDIEETMTFYRASPSGRGPSTAQELAQARTARASSPSAGPVMVGMAESGGRSVPTRIVVPDGGFRGVHLNLHGGGFYMGSAADDDARSSRLAEALGVVVVGVDYRLAPEHPWPAAPDDCETAALWLIDRAEEVFGTSRITVGGFSAGATLAVTTLLRLRERGMAQQVAGAALQFGTWDLSGTTPAGRLIADEYFLDAYVGHVPDRTIADVSPIFADLAGLPPTLLIVGERDTLLEDTMTMAARLSLAGVDVDLRVYPVSPHGFTAHPTPVAAAAVNDIMTWLGERLDLDDGTHSVSTPQSMFDDREHAMAWDDASMTALRMAVASGGRVLVDLLRASVFQEVLQFVGDALIAAVEDGVTGADAVAADVAAALRVRSWSGDLELAEQIDAALTSTTPMLRPLTVDLDELSSLLEGDMAYGGGRIDLQTGQTWPDNVFEVMDTELFGEEALDDPDRWLFVECTGSRAGYRDMEDFVDSVVDEDLAEKLRIALIGRGAFRRFKDVLYSSTDEYARYHLFSQERKAGRARSWLTDQGYRVRVER